MSRAFWIGVVVFLVVVAVLLAVIGTCPATKEKVAEEASNKAHDVSAKAETHVDPADASDAHEAAAKAHANAAAKNMSSYKAYICKYFQASKALRNNPQLATVVKKQRDAITMASKLNSVNGHHNMRQLPSKYIALLDKIDSYLGSLSTVEAGSPKDTQLLLDIADSYDDVKAEQEKVVSVHSKAAEYSGASLFQYFSFYLLMHDIRRRKDISEKDKVKIVRQINSVLTSELGKHCVDDVCVIAQKISAHAVSKLGQTKTEHLFSSHNMKKLVDCITKSSANDTAVMKSISDAVDAIQQAQHHSHQTDLHKALESEAKVKSVSASVKAVHHAEGEVASVHTHKEKKHAIKIVEKHNKKIKEKVAKLKPHEEDAVLAEMHRRDRPFFEKEFKRRIK